MAGGVVLPIDGCAPLGDLRTDPYYFRDCLISRPVPHKAFAASAVWHVVFVVLILPLARYLPDPPKAALPHTQIYWYGPIDDLPLIAPRSAPAKRATKAPASHPEKAPAELAAAEAFHPRQTIVNEPMRPDHPRQTLIQPAAAPVAPAILPDLPNIVAWDAPSRPQLPVDALVAVKRAAVRDAEKEISAPDLPSIAEPPGPIDLIGAAAKPALPIAPMSAPRAAARQAADVAAPEIAVAAPQGAQLIALSAAPAPERPPEIPQGNLSSRLAISPEGGAAGTPAARPDTATSVAGAGPAGLSISGGRAPASSTAGGLRLVPGTPARVAPGTPAAPGVGASRTQPSSSLRDRLQPGMPPEGLLGPKHVHTLRFSMANLTSATGSWVLSFAELVTLGPQAAASEARVDLSGPTALRKVDPKYPPELRDNHVEGEVILYAVIRANGTVDSIQLIRGIDPVLDANAMQALAQWKFSPAERQGVPVDIETVVRIPFRAVAPAY